MLSDRDEVVPMSEVVWPGTTMSPSEGIRRRLTTMSSTRRSVTRIVPLSGCMAGPSMPDCCSRRPHSYPVALTTASAFNTSPPSSSTLQSPILFTPRPTVISAPSRYASYRLDSVSKKGSTAASRVRMHRSAPGFGDPEAGTSSANTPDLRHAGNKRSP
ncbi:MAG: hypothetical protein A4E28_03068 [Methanocella sp. PtaU1.Bin125]|nr:MAG: hypothetical protein A4E28_03068 [Methanocella sp. PtaU1.Bin125]